MSLPTRPVVLGVASGVGLLGAIVATALSLYTTAPVTGQDGGTIRECECALTDIDDAGNVFHDPVILAFTYNDNTDASTDNRITSACTVEANAACQTTGIAFADLTPDQRECFLAGRAQCQSSNSIDQALHCYVCAPEYPGFQAQPIRILPRALSQAFNCSCAIQAYDAGNCRLRIPYADAGPYLVDAPPSTTLAHGLGIGPGCLRGLPCWDVAQIRAEQGIGYPVASDCRPQLDGGP